jgi:hypothetical protein
MDLMEKIIEGIPIGISEGITSSSIKLFVDYIKSKFFTKSSFRDHLSETPLEGIEKHLIEENNWSSQIQFLGMSTPGAIDDYTIGLGLHTEPRRFRGKEEPNKIKTEEDLFVLPGNYLLLGSPGSGKTTTLKRLCRRILLKPPKVPTDIYQFPIVIRFRELSGGASICTTIADIFGLKYHQVKFKKTIETKAKKLHERGERGPSSFTISHVETRIGDRQIEDVIAELLNNTYAILILDGLDEVKNEILESIRKEIVILGRKLHSSKIILSLRSGEYNFAFEGFNVFEICPLTESQIKAISKRWLENPESFLTCIKSLPYYDLADRPLLLTQLLFIFKRYGYLPEQPSIIYKKVVRLLLEEWDAQRDITRLSKYAGFDPERKTDFLSALSFHLTYSLNEKRFSEDSLMKCYMKIYQSFNLRESEALMVIKEIETHTGIIIAGPDDSYEFSHLSLQEYLSASYLSRAPMLLDVSYLIGLYPAPLAVSVVLSSTPGLYFAQLMLNPRNIKAFTPRNLVIFLSRLLVEKPFFELSESLAFALFHLYNVSQDAEVISKLDEMLKINNVLESMATATRWYKIHKSRKKRNFLELHIKGRFENLYGFDVPETGCIPKKIIPDLFKISSSGIFYMDSNGLLRRLTKSKIKWLLQ